MSAASEGGMSPTAVRVKEEPECAGASEAAAAGLYLQHEVKDELECAGAGECGASEAAAAGLYLQHEVKHELVLGPERLQPQDIAYAMQKPVNGMDTITVKRELSSAAGHEAHAFEESPWSSKSYVEQVTLRSCYVKLQRILIEEYAMSAAGECGMSPPAVRVKEESEFAGASEAAAAGLYLQHEVKDELVLGPERLQPQDIAYTMHISEPLNGMETRTVKRELSPAAGADADPSEESPCSSKSHNEQLALRSCYVKLQRIHIEEVSHACTTCHQTFLLESNLNTRKCIPNKEETSLKFVIGKKVFNINDTKLIEHIQIHAGQKPYTCNLCKIQFKNGFCLSQLKNVHTGLRLYSCDVCKKQFTDSSYLARHKLIYTGEKPYTCDVCAKQFRLPLSLIHHNLIHTGEKPYSCDVCKKHLSNSFSLARHKLIHTGEKPYSCNVCNQQFKYSSHLTIHKRVHTGEKPYSCDDCKKLLSHSVSLARHKLIHTTPPYSCDVCKKQFTRKWYLANHILVHTGAKPYSCDVCKKRFTQSSSLTRHKLIIHT